MKGMTTILGVLFLVFGLFVLARGGFSYKEDKKVVDIGPIDIHKETTKHVPIAPILGGLMAASGAGLVVLGATRH